jgi:DNA-binding MarR family transcriptional regulator
VDLEALATDLNSVAIHLVRRLRRSDQSLGIAPARLSALSVLVFGGPRSLRALADAEHVASPTMSKIVAALEGDGLVRRQAVPSDARSVTLSATPRGRRLMEKGRRQRVENLVAELSGLTAAEATSLREAVSILRSLE